MQTSKLTQIITRKTSVALNLPERDVDEVMSFHWRTALQATKEHSSIEISGFGRFDIRDTKTRGKLALYEKYEKAYEKRLASLTPQDKDYHKYMLKLERISADIKFLKERLNEA